MEESRFQLVLKIILACAVLHNTCILFVGKWEEENENDDPSQGDNDDIIRDGDNFRQILKGFLSSS